jgi:hypothetical protein
MIQDLQLKGYSESTQKLYISAVRQLCEHFDKTPGQLTEEDIRDYFPARFVGDILHGSGNCRNHQGHRHDNAFL